MQENKIPYQPFPGMNCTKETVCIDTNRVLDCCRDRDCFENARVYLSDFGNDILNHTGAIRVKCAEIMWTNIAVDPIQFNRGFYSITIRFFVKVICEACVGGGHAQELEGVAVLEKKVILYGGDSNASIFKSVGENGSFCSAPCPNVGTKNVPTAVVEVVNPVVLGSKIVEKENECTCCCCCKGCDIPEPVLQAMEAPLSFDEGRANRYLAVSFGIFSVIRITRPSQLLVQATEYSVPEKECIQAEEDDPCKVFHSMPFPASEFSAQPNPNGGGSSCRPTNGHGGHCLCGGRGD